jgi:AraC-like DNA-binding protein
MKNRNIIDTTLEQARTWGNALYLTDGLVLTDQIAHAPISKEPQRMNFILMALCRKGRAQYSIDTHKQTVEPGDLLFISERHIVDDYEATSDFECLCIMLSTQFYHGFVQNVKNVSSLLLFSMNNPVVHLTAKEIQTYSNYYHTIREKIADESHHYRTELVQAWLLAMFYDMSGVIWRIEQSSAKKQSRSDVIFAQFIALLQEHYRKERRVGWYASQLGITAKYLSEVVNQVSKRTPNEWIDSYVVLELRVMLRNSPMTIKEITEAMNFPNQSFLGKYFKEHVGVSPSEFRKG